MCGRVEDRDAERTGLTEESDTSQWRDTRRESGIQRNRRVVVRDAESIRPDQAHAVLTDLLDEAMFALQARLTAFAESRRHDHERAHALDHAVVEHLVDARRGHRDHREIDRIGNVAHRRVRADSPDRRRPHAGRPRRAAMASLWLARRPGTRRVVSRSALLIVGFTVTVGTIDREHRAGESGRNDVGQQRVSHLLGIGRRPDHGNRRRSQQVGDAARLGGALTVVAHREHRLGGIDRELDVHRRAVECARDLVAGVAEDGDHVGILAEHLGLEAGESVLGSGTGEMFEQNRPEAAALVFVGDDEGDLGRFGLAVGGESLVDADRDDLPTEHCDDRNPVAVVDRCHACDLARRKRRRRTEVAHVPGAFGQTRVESDDAVGVVGNDRTQMHHATVGREDIGDPVSGVIPRTARALTLSVIVPGSGLHG
ncbi:Uncharacterised protein [Mycobacteroides abscessus subsp. abscessus]|nr:Uncharacterised protein [Mycobacteroides abscessus subsp. abscessus]